MRTQLTLIAVPLAMLFACGDDASPGAGSGGGGTASVTAGAMSGGNATAGTPSTSGGSTTSGAGGAPTAGAATTGGSPTTAGQAGASGGAAGSAGASSSAGTGGGGGAGCTRELLKSTVDAYFKALATHAVSTLPLASDVKHTENGKASKPGEAGLWKTAGTLKYAHSAFDTETCQSASEAVVPDGTTDIPIALRLKLVNQQITEIETIAVRSGDYSLASNTAALAASNTSIKWEEIVPTDMRNMRAELTGWMEKYFKQFPQGVCDTVSNCKRIENGAGNFVCSEGAGCAASSGGSDKLKPRLVFADVEAGIGVGFTLFTGGYADMHMFKMYGSKVYAVSAILAEADSSGWD